MTDDDHKQLKPRADDGWFKRLCAWADKFDIPEAVLPRDKAEL